MFKSLLKSITTSFLNLIYCEKCLICSCAKTDELLCKSCLKDVELLSSFPQKIYKEIPIFCACLYKGNLKTLIQLLKFSHKKKASKPLASILYSYYKNLNLNKNYIIVFPPSYYLKSAQRGYNHMFLIAKEFSKLTNFEIKKDLIKKIKPTKPQYKAKNRHTNIQGSFAINKKYIEQIKNKNILIIDDITTSGATIEELINCFLDVEIKNITCLVLSKAGC
ncbi:MAG: ComF family protein [Candidatus Gastranaerophilales bacterium]|nr:ComF family protein [Candidatus Gastranaerophilales bacterium]